MPWSSGDRLNSANLNAKSGYAFISVLDPAYSADSSGAADSTASIQAALNAGSASSMAVFAPAGTYLINPVSQLTLRAGALIGAGMGLTIFKRINTTNDNRILWFGDDTNSGVTYTDIVIRDITFDGNRANSTQSGSNQLVFAKYVDRFALTNVEIRNAPFFGMQIKNAVHGTLNNIQVYNTNRDGLNFSDGCEFIALNNFVGRDTGDDSLAFVTSTNAACRYITASNIVCEDSGLNSDGAGTGGAGIKLAGAQFVNIANAFITNAADGGVMIETLSGQTAQDIVITGLSVLTCGTRSAAAVKSGVNISAGKRIFVQGQIAGASADGVTVTSGSSDVVLDVATYRAGRDGVRVDGSTGHVYDVELRGVASTSSACGVLCTTADSVRLTSMACVNNNQHGNTDDSNAVGASFTSCKGVMVVGGDFSDTQAVATQRFGLRFYGTACAGVYITGAKATGNVSTAVGFVTTPTAPWRVANTEGYTQNGKDVLTNNDGLFLLSGSGAAESNVTAPIGSWYMRTDAGPVFAVKESGTGNTGWASVATV